MQYSVLFLVVSIVVFVVFIKNVISFIRRIIFNLKRDDIDLVEVHKKDFSDLSEIEFIGLWKELAAALKVSPNKLRSNDKILDLATLYSFQEHALDDFEEFALRKGIDTKFLDRKRTLKDLIREIARPNSRGVSSLL